MSLKSKEPVRFALIFTIFAAVTTIAAANVQARTLPSASTAKPLVGYAVGLQIGTRYSAKAGTIYFTFTAINDGDSAFKKVVIGFTPNLRPWGLTDGRLVIGPHGQALRWPAGTLQPGQSASITIPVKAPKKARSKICVNATLGSAQFSPFPADKPACWQNY